MRNGRNQSISAPRPAHDWLLTAVGQARVASCDGLKAVISSCWRRRHVRSGQPLDPLLFWIAHEFIPVLVKVTNLPQDLEFAPMLFHLTR